MYSKFISSCLVALCLLVGGTPAVAAPAASLARPELQTPAPSGRIVVRLAPDSGLRLGAAGLEAVDPAKAAALDRTADRLAALAGGAALQPRFPSLGARPDKVAADPGLAALARYGQLDARTRDRDALLRMLAALNADPLIDLAFLEPVAVPAALGFDAFTGVGPLPAAVDTDVPAITPDFEPQQSYLDAAPLGIGAWAMRAQPGARGAGLSIIDVEGAWLWEHEDLPAASYELGEPIPDQSWRNHGTAVMGEMRGQDNGLGVTGIVPDCAVGGSSIYTASVADALLAAAGSLGAGDLILIELHAPGPNATGEGQFGYVPMEYWQDNFDAIRWITGQGLLVVEAAGNGSQDLDDPVYDGLFDRSLRDSGAILCGATAGSELTSAWFSNNGTRVDLNGYGYYVVSTGYGDLQGGQEDKWYTAAFSGTSSASPIVTGAVASLQGMVRERHGLDLDARLARDLLRSTGTPTSGTLIGTRPDLAAAYALADTGIGALAGTVRDASTLAPLAGVLVRVAGDGAFTVTAADGGWRLPLLTGPVDLEFSSFYYEPLAAAPVVPFGTTGQLDVLLSPLPLIDLTGTVYGAGAPLAGAMVTPVDQPVPGAVSGPDGAFAVAQVPAGHLYTLRFDGVPGFGARVVPFDAVGATGDIDRSPVMPLIAEDFEDDDGGFAPADTLWRYGLPPVAVTGGAFSGERCWGIGMDGAYGDGQADTLTSPRYDLSAVSGPAHYLSFHFFCATEPGFDGVNLAASADDETWTVLTPLDGYTDLSLGGLGGDPGWSGAGGRWRGAVFDLSAFSGGQFRFRLAFGSDAGVTAEGFYVDGIAFDGGLLATPVADRALPSPVAALRAWPNPFNPSLTLEYSLARAGRLQVAVYDVRGRRVARLLDQTVAAGLGTLTWNGRGDDGRALPSAVYLVRVQGPDGRTAVERVVLAK